jgi:hypothetical protein
MRSSVPDMRSSVEVMSSVIWPMSTLSKPLDKSAAIGTATEAAVCAPAFIEEKRRSILIGCCPATSILPRKEMVDSPRARSVEPMVLKMVMFRRIGVRNLSCATS